MVLCKRDKSTNKAELNTLMAMSKRVSNILLRSSTEVVEPCMETEHETSPDHMMCLGDMSHTHTHMHTHTHIHLLDLTCKLAQLVRAREC